jgi:hypothetical protein
MSQKRRQEIKWPRTDRRDAMQAMQKIVPSVFEVANDPAVKAAKKAPLSATAQEKLEAWKSRETKRLEAEFDERVRTGIVEGNKEYLETLDRLKREASEKAVYYRELINNRKPIFTEAEYMYVLRSCHPDNSASEEVRRAAFMAINAKKFTLTGKK